MRWAHPQVADPKPRLYQDFLHQNTESSLLRAEFENQLKPFEIIHEVARPCRFDLTSKLFVDFGSCKTNPKLSLSGVAVQAVFAACWEEHDDLTERRKFCSGMAVPPLLPALRASQGRYPCSQAQKLGRSFKINDLVHLPPCTRGVALRSWGFESSHALPSFCNLPKRLGKGLFPLNVPSQAAVLINRVSKQEASLETGTWCRVGLHKQQDWVNKSGLAVGFPTRNLPLRLWIFLDPTCLFLGGIINAEGNKEKSQVLSLGMENLLFSTKSLWLRRSKTEGLYFRSKNMLQVTVKIACSWCLLREGKLFKETAIHHLTTIK